MKQKLKYWKQGFRKRYNAWLLHGFIRLTFWSDKFKRRLSPLGQAWLAGIVLTLVFGANVKQSSIYQLFALIVALFSIALLAVWLMSRRRSERLNISRMLPKFATVGMLTQYNIQVKNISDKAVKSFSLMEVSGSKSPSLAQFSQMREPDEEKRNWYDRNTGYYRFVWLKNWLRGVSFEHIDVLGIKKGGYASYTIPLLPIRRGFIHFSQLIARFPEPLGLVYSFETYKRVDVLLVLPQAYRLPASLVLNGKRTYQQGGIAQSSHIGESEEFHKLREYQDGDSPRRIFWPSLARTGQPLVKEFQDEYFTRSALVLDNFAAENKRLLFEEAIAVAAGFAMQTDTNDMLLDLMFVGQHKHADHVLTGRALAHAEQMLEALASLAISEGDFSKLTQAVLQQAERLGGCVLIFLNWDEARQDLVKQLQALSIPVLVFLMQEQIQQAIYMDGVLVHQLKVGQIQKDLDGVVCDYT